MLMRLFTRNGKGIMGVVAIIMLVALMSATAFAADTSKNGWYNVSTEPPTNVSACGLSKPSKSSYVDLNEKALTFAGEAQGSTLYTNKCFTGKSTVSYSITNYCDTDLTVKIYATSSLFATKTMTVEANSTLSGTIDGLDKDAYYYLKFSAPSDFSGSIS